MSKHNMGKPVKLIPLLGGIKCRPDKTSDFVGTSRIDDASTVVLRTTGVDQLPTQLMPAIAESRTISANAPPPVAQTTSDESYLGLMRNLAKNSGIYAISSLASPLVTLLLAPFL